MECDAPLGREGNRHSPSKQTLPIVALHRSASHRKINKCQPQQCRDCFKESSALTSSLLFSFHRLLHLGLLPSSASRSCVRLSALFTLFAPSASSVIAVEHIHPPTTTSCPSEGRLCFVGHCRRTNSSAGYLLFVHQSAGFYSRSTILTLHAIDKQYPPSHSTILIINAAATLRRAGAGHSLGLPPLVVISAGLP